MAEELILGDVTLKYSRDQSIDTMNVRSQERYCEIINSLQFCQRDQNVSPPLEHSKIHVIPEIIEPFLESHTSYLSLSFEDAPF